MKKIITSLFLFASVSVAFSQTFKFWDHSKDVTNDTIVVYTAANTAGSYQTEIGLQNTTSATVGYKVSRIFLSGPVTSGNDVYFCAGSQCYPPDAAFIYTGVSETIGANVTLPDSANPLFFGILADYDLNTIPASDFYVTYSVKNIAVAGDSSTVVIYYKASGVGINELSNSGSIANAYPNPSSTFTSINYTMEQFDANSKIIVYDMLGKSVKEISLTEKQGTVKLNVSEMIAGVYFYSFIVNDKAISTKKLVVSSSK